MPSDTCQSQGRPCVEDVLSLSLAVAMGGSKEKVGACSPEGQKLCGGLLSSS